MFKKLIEQRGSTNSIEFIIYYALIVFIMFSGVDYYVAQTRYGIVEDVKNRTIDRMRIEGWLTISEQQKIVSELSSMGYKNIELGGTLEGIVDEPVTRDAANSEVSIVVLTITAQPKEKPFLFGRLVGTEDNGEFIIKVKGEALSEKPSNY